MGAKKNHSDRRLNKIIKNYITIANEVLVANKYDVIGGPQFHQMNKDLLQYLMENPLEIDNLETVRYVGRVLLENVKNGKIIFDLEFQPTVENPEEENEMCKKCGKLASKNGRTIETKLSTKWESQAAMGRIVDSLGDDADYVVDLIESFVKACNEVLNRRGYMPVSDAMYVETVLDVCEVVLNGSCDAAEDLVLINSSGFVAIYNTSVKSVVCDITECHLISDWDDSEEDDENHSKLIEKYIEVLNETLASLSLGFVSGDDIICIQRQMEYKEWENPIIVVDGEYVGLFESEEMEIIHDITNTSATLYMRD